MNQFVQIHTLTGYNSVLLNRDDTGLSKRLEYGGSTRTRTSSQFAKRKIRLAQGAASISELGSISVRSRETFKREIAKPLIGEPYFADDYVEDGYAEKLYPEDIVVEATLVIMDAVFKPSAAADKARAAARKDVEAGKRPLLSLLERDEINVLTRPEIEYLASVVKDLVQGAKSAKEAADKAKAFVKEGKHKQNLQAMGESSAMALDVAMFGRMVTGDVLSSVDGAVHVAHAISTHRQETETDFFTAVDDLVTGDGDNGSAHMGETELTSPLLYGYWVVDWNELMNNLKGAENREQVGRLLVEKLVILAATSVNGAKKGSTAPYSSADLVLIEVGSSQPRSLAEAFRVPSKPTLDDSTAAMAGYIKRKDAMYPSDQNRWIATISDVAFPAATPGSVPEIASAAAATLGR